MTFTGVGCVFSAAHQPPEGGPVHGHSYEVTAWFDAGADARELQARLVKAVERFDHQLLDPAMASGEAIAESLGRALDGCRQVDIARPLERIYARWTAD